MPAIAFSEAETYVHPVPAWRFWVTLPTIPGLSSDGQILSFLAQKFVATHRGIDYEQVPFQAGVRNFATGYHTEAITATFVEDYDFNALKYFQAWCALIISPDGSFALPATYKRPITIDSLGHGGGVLKTVTYLDCSPVRPDPHDFDGTSTAYLPTSISFMTDGEDVSDSSSNGSSNFIEQLQGLTSGLGF